MSLFNPSISPGVKQCDTNRKPIVKQELLWFTLTLIEPVSSYYLIDTAWNGDCIGVKFLCNVCKFVDIYLWCCKKHRQTFLTLVICLSLFYHVSGLNICNQWSKHKKKLHKISTTFHLSPFTFPHITYQGFILWL